MASADDYGKFLPIPPDRLNKITKDFAADRPPDASYTDLERECYAEMAAEFAAFKAKNPGVTAVVHLPFDAGAD